MSETSTPALRRRVAVTAMGVISPLGVGLGENLASLRAGRDAVFGVSTFDVSRCRAKTAGQVARTFAARDRELHGVSEWMIQAGTEAHAGDPGFAPELAVIGTTSGGMSCGQDFHRAQIERRRPRERARWLANYMPQKAVNDALGVIGCVCPAQIIANACASGTNALGHAFRLVRAGLHERVLCGGFDVISELVFVGFDSLQAATTEKVRPFDRRAQRPRARRRRGGAVRWRNSNPPSKRRGAPIIAEISGYGISTDNHHLTQPHPSGIGPRAGDASARSRMRGGKPRRGGLHQCARHGDDHSTTRREGAAIAKIFRATRAGQFDERR